MNIVILTYIFYPEPIAMSAITEDLANYLSANHNVTVVSSSPCRPYGYELQKDIHKPEWPFQRVILDSYTHPKSSLLGRLRENLSFGRAAIKYIHKHHDQIDAIYMNVCPLFAQSMVVRTAKRYGIGVVNHIEDIYPEPLAQKMPICGKILYEILLPLDRWLINNATSSVVIGNKIKEYYIATRNVAAESISVVYNWQDESRFATRYEQPTNAKFTFMYVGSISRAADLHNVLNAFAIANIDNARLVFAGSGTEKESLVAQAARYSNCSIEFVNADYDCVAKIQSGADVLILPLLAGVSMRAVPSKLPAYMFSRRPILACVEQESDVAFIINNGKCGWTVPPESPEQLAHKMQEIVQMSKSQLNSMGESGYSYSQAHLTRRVNLKALADIVVSAAHKV